MTYEIGDPDHIEVHESIRLLFMAAGLDPDLIPGTATIGATGHVDDHNRIADALAWLDENGIPGPAPATLSGTTGSPTVGTGLGGRALYEWTGNGTFTVATAGWIRVVNVSGGKAGVGSTTNAGGGGIVQDFYLYVTPGTYTVTIGAGGTYPSGSGGASSVVKVNASVIRGTIMATNNVGNGAENNTAAGILSDIDGTDEGFGGSGWSTTNTGTYDAQYGGATAAAVPRANSGGGGNEIGSGNGAAGCVKILL
jgi:hypothetical protein